MDKLQANHSFKKYLMLHLGVTSEKESISQPKMNDILYRPQAWLEGTFDFQGYLSSFIGKESLGFPTSIEGYSTMKIHEKNIFSTF